MPICDLDVCLVAEMVRPVMWLRRLRAWWRYLQVSIGCTDMDESRNLLQNRTNPGRHRTWTGEGAVKAGHIELPRVLVTQDVPPHSQPPGRRPPAFIRDYDLTGRL